MCWCFLAARERTVVSTLAERARGLECRLSRSILPGLHLGEVQHVVHHIQQVLAAVRGSSAGIPAVYGEALPALQLQELAEAEDGVQRRAQLVAHVGEETALCRLAASAAALACQSRSSMAFRSVMSSFTAR